MITIRNACVEDVEDIIHINIETWKSAYKGIIASETLEKLDQMKEERVKRARAEFGTRHFDGHVIHQSVACYKEKVIGFATFGKARPFNGKTYNRMGEVYAIYVLDQYQGMQAGKKLIENTFRSMNQMHTYDEVIVWTLTKNKSRGFYERLGGISKFKKSINISGQELDEIGYVYSLAQISDR
tara:strand:- start:20 stop:568 length:549 start_codon:yes stop_codon:yes gene_type:complete